MDFAPLSPVVRVFLLVSVGFAFARWKKITLTMVTEIIVYLGTPSLVFTSLAGKSPFGFGHCSSMFWPAAVINFVLTEKYRQDPELAASIVVFSTAIAVVTISLVFWLIL